jgi:6-phosphogluconate dehydrogenase
MQLGFVGLGKMGLNMVTRLIDGGHQIVAFDRDPAAVGRASDAGATGVASLDATGRRALHVHLPSPDPALLGSILDSLVPDA